MTVPCPAQRQRRLFDPGDDGAADLEFWAGEFFAGIGLVRLALEQAGIGVRFANDIDADKQAMYQANFGGDDFQLADVHSLTALDVPHCDLFTASFPCTNLSVAGAMQGIHAGQSSAFWGFLDVVKDLGQSAPGVILLENVPGFLMTREGEDFAAALLALNEQGYHVDAVFLDAARFVPQSRMRLFVIAKRIPVGSAKRPLAPSVLRPAPLTEFINSHPEIRWDIAELPDPPQLAPRLESIIEDLPDDHAAWWSLERTDYFMGQLSERHATTARAMIESEEIRYATAFRRVRKGRSMAELRTDGIAGCLRTPRGGSGRQILFKAGRGRRQVRLLTPRECARLQGTPDDYVIDVSANKALFGFGDAVCVPAVAWIAQHALVPALQQIRGASARKSRKAPANKGTNR